MSSAASKLKSPGFGARDFKTTKILGVELARNEASFICSYCGRMLASLSIALEFLQAFDEAGWPAPAPVKLKPTDCAPTQMDQDLIVARHLSIAANMRELIRQPFYPKGDGLFVELAETYSKLQSEAEFFAKYHDADQDKETAQLQALTRWYVQKFEPLLSAVTEALTVALEDKSRWKLPEFVPNIPVHHPAECQKQSEHQNCDSIEGVPISNPGLKGYHPLSFRARMARLRLDQSR